MQIAQHVPGNLRQGIVTHNTSLIVQDSAIGQHLSDNPDCADKYTDFEHGWQSICVLEVVYSESYQQSVPTEKEICPFSFTRQLMNPDFLTF